MIYGLHFASLSRAKGYNMEQLYGTMEGKNGYTNINILKGGKTLCAYTPRTNDWLHGHLGKDERAKFESAEGSILNETPKGDIR